MKLHKQKYVVAVWGYGQVETLCTAFSGHTSVLASHKTVWKLGIKISLPIFVLVVSCRKASCRAPKSTGNNSETTAQPGARPPRGEAAQQCSPKWVVAGVNGWDVSITPLLCCRTALCDKSCRLLSANSLFPSKPQFRSLKVVKLIPRSWELPISELVICCWLLESGLSLL